MDSMYGPMSWLRLHAAGKQVIGLTSAPRTQTDFRLERPINSAGVARDARPDHRRRQRRPRLPNRVAPGRALGHEPARRCRTTNCRKNMPLKPREDLRAPSPAPKLPRLRAGRLAGADHDRTCACRTAPHLLHPRRVAAVAAAARTPRSATGSPPANSRASVRYQLGNGPAVLIDADARQYHGPAALKPLAGYFDGAVEARSISARSTMRPGAAKPPRSAPRNRSRACSGTAACSPARASCCRASTRRRSTA